jgi:hypothetical protein
MIERVVLRSGVEVPSSQPHPKIIHRRLVRYPYAREDGGRMVCESEQQGGAKLGHIQLVHRIRNIYFRPTVLFFTEPAVSSAKGVLKEYSRAYKFFYSFPLHPRITLKRR